MEIKKFQPVDHYVRATVYGGSWVWKTVFWWTAPKPIFASAENGLLSIVSTLWYSPDYVTINSISDMQELYKFLKAWNHWYETLVIDSMTEMNEIIKDWIEKRIWKAMEIQDWWELARKLKWIIRSMQDLPIHIILICQEKIESDKKWNVLNVKPMLNWKTSDEVAYLMDIVAYMYINSKGERVITTTPNEKLVSKDRTWLLQTDVSLNFNDWVTAMQWMTTWKSEVVRSVPKQDAPKSEQPAAPIPPRETAPVEIAKPAPQKKMSNTDRMVAMTWFSKYCNAANPGVDTKAYFEAMVVDRFWKPVEDLTEDEWKQLVQIVQDIVADYAAKEASQAVVDDAIADESTTEDQAEIQPDDAVYINDQWWAEKTQPAQDAMQDVIDDLPF